MNINLTFDDFAKLAANGKLEKDGVVLAFERPVLSELDYNPHARTGRVVFYLDEADEKQGATPQRP